MYANKSTMTGAAIPVVCSKHKEWRITMNNTAIVELSDLELGFVLGAGETWGSWGSRMASWGAWGGGVGFAVGGVAGAALGAAVGVAAASLTTAVKIAIE